MAMIYQNRPDEVFLFSEAPGFQSREAVKLKAGSVYESGSVLVAEMGGEDLDEPTGFHVLATSAATKAVVLCRRTDATAAAVDAAVIANAAEVKANELTVAVGATVAGVTPALNANGIKVRA